MLLKGLLKQLSGFPYCFHRVVEESSSFTCPLLLFHHFFASNTPAIVVPHPTIPMIGRKASRNVPIWVTMVHVVAGSWVEPLGATLQ